VGSLPVLDAWLLNYFVYEVGINETDAVRRVKKKNVFPKTSTRA
jgi:hypothetical protein